MIHTSLSPNTERDDLWLTLKSLILPWNWFFWRKGDEVAEFERSFGKYLNAEQAIAFHSGRDALYTLLKALGIGQGDEVILQAYTCIVVPNAVQFTGATPVYVDIEEVGFNIDPQQIESVINSNTKAIIIQHTFGEPADIEVITAICKKYRLLLIEDCAHALSGRFQGSKLGTFGDAAIWSFGRDKIISSVWGGMVTSKDKAISDKVRQIHDVLKFPGSWQIFQALMHPLVLSLIKPFYVWKMGKFALVILQKLRLIPRVILPIEKKGKKPGRAPQRMSNALARLVHHQLKKLHRFQQHRRSLVDYYSNALRGVSGIQLPHPGLQADPAWLRYTIRTPRAQQILKAAQKRDIYLGDWYTTVLAPSDCPPQHFQYSKSSCPRAERAARETLNLPTHIQMTKKQTEEVVDILKKNL
jgi:dTDP-4-amino-4,6-dideoxygalactose transaminase